MNTAENKYYVYVHIKPDGSPFYVGKGLNKRAYQRSGRSDWWKKTVNKHGYDIVLLEEDLSEEESLKKEIYWIKRIGRVDLKEGLLINQTDGGEGGNGYKCSNITREKMSQIKIGNKNGLGYKHTEETKERMSEIKKGTKRSEEAKRKTSEKLKGELNPNFGKKASEKTRKLMSKARTGVSKEGTIVLDLSTGVFYESIKEASDYNSIKHTTLYNQLIGINKNKTNLIIV